MLKKIDLIINGLNESLDNDILDVYRLILKYQTSSYKDERLGDEIKDQIYDIWNSDMKSVFTEWLYGHGQIEKDEIDSKYIEEAKEYYFRSFNALSEEFCSGNLFSLGEKQVAEVIWYAQQLLYGDDLNPVAESIKEVIEKLEYIDSMSVDDCIVWFDQAINTTHYSGELIDKLDINYYDLRDRIDNLNNERE